MLVLRRCIMVGALACATAPPAEAQTRVEPRLGPASSLPSMGGAGGMLALMPVGEEATIGLGRFAVPDPPRPRTHTEHERDPTAVHRRQRGIGGVGLKLRF